MFTKCKYPPSGVGHRVLSCWGELFAFTLWGYTVVVHTVFTITALTSERRPRITTRVVTPRGLDCGVKQWVYTSVATKLCCSGALLCGAVAVLYCAVLLRCCTVRCCCGAVAVLYCCVTVVGTVFELQHELLQHWVDTFSSNPTVVTLQ